MRIITRVLIIMFCAILYFILIMTPLYMIEKNRSENFCSAICEDYIIRWFNCYCGDSQPLGIIIYGESIPIDNGEKYYHQIGGNLTIITTSKDYR